MDVYIHDFFQQYLKTVNYEEWNCLSFNSVNFRSYSKVVSKFHKPSKKVLRFYMLCEAFVNLNFQILQSLTILSR